MVRKQTARLVGIGAALGLMAGAGLSRLTASLLYNVSPLDPLTFAGGTVILVVVAIVAATFPIRRATRVDPIRALRTE
jgi:ABC-type antimicrobial peptide transport system permease subunit